MSTFGRRLRKLELVLEPGGPVFRGTHEIHYLHAWPVCEGAQGIQQCLEHAPSCGVSIAPTLAPDRQALVLRHSPWLGLD